MAYNVYQLRDGTWRFEDSRGVVHDFATQRGAKRMATIAWKFFEESIKKLYYNANGNSFGQKAYEHWYRGHTQAYNALNESGKETALQHMFDDFSNNDESEFDCVTFSNGDEIQNIHKTYDDNYSITTLMQVMGLKVSKLYGQERVFRDADSDYERYYRESFHVVAG